MTDNVSPAGWYPDDSGSMRWWNGTEWTEHFQLADLPSAKAPKGAADSDATRLSSSEQLGAATGSQSVLGTSPTSASPSSPGGPWYAKRWVIGATALIVGIVIGSGSSGSSDPKKSDQYQSLSATYSSARGDVSSLKSDLADARAEEETLKTELSDAKDAKVAADKKAKAAQSLLAASATPKTPKPAQTTSAAPTTHACTKTASGSCIQGGQFCRQALYGQSGFNATGTRYTCTGDHTHPHWE